MPLRLQHTHTHKPFGTLGRLENQQTAKGASGKGPRPKKAKIVKTCQKYFGHIRHFRARQKERPKSSKCVKNIQASSTTTRDRNLQFRGVVLEALSWIFCFFSSIYVQFSKTSPLQSGESSENPVEKIASNPVTSVAVMVFSALKICSTLFRQFSRGTSFPAPCGGGLLRWAKNARLKTDTRVSETRVLKTLACRNGFLDLF